MSGDALSFMTQRMPGADALFALGRASQPITPAPEPDPPAVASPAPNLPEPASATAAVTPAAQPAAPNTGTTLLTQAPREDTSRIAKKRLLGS